MGPRASRPFGLTAAVLIALSACNPGGLDVALLTVSRSGAGGGSVRTSTAGGGIDCGAQCMEDYQRGATVSLVAAPDVRSVFHGWSGDCVGIGVCALTMDKDRQVTAELDLASLALTVVKSGAGGGTVTSTPDGVRCGATCKATFVYGTNVKLAATPDPGSRFTGWSGDCAGSDAGGCSVTMSAAHTVTATFDP